MGLISQFYIQILKIKPKMIIFDSANANFCYNTLTFGAGK